VRPRAGHQLIDKNNQTYKINFIRTSCRLTHIDSLCVKTTHIFCKNTLLRIKPWILWYFGFVLESIWVKKVFFLKKTKLKKV